MNTQILVKMDASTVLAHDTGPINKIHRLLLDLNIPGGTADGKADLIWSDTRTLDGAEFVDIRAYTDVDGTARTIAELIGLIVVHHGASTTLTIGGSEGSSINIFSAVDDKVIIGNGPNAMFFWLAPNQGVSVSNGSTDVVTIESATSTTYTIYILGRSS